MPLDIGLFDEYVNKYAAGRSAAQNLSQPAQNVSQTESNDPQGTGNTFSMGAMTIGGNDSWYPTISIGGVRIVSDPYMPVGSYMLVGSSVMTPVRPPVIFYGSSPVDLLPRDFWQTMPAQAQPEPPRKPVPPLEFPTQRKIVLP